MEAEDNVHLCITLREISAMYKPILLLQLPIGVLPYIEVIQEFFSSLKGFKEKQQKSKFSGNQQILHQQTIKINELKQTATLKYIYSSSQMAEFYSVLRASNI